MTFGYALYWRMHGVQMLELAAFSDTPSPSVTRLVFTDRDMEARRSFSSFDAG